MKKIKVIELFAGIGSQVQALKNLNIPFESVGISEIDKFALQSYELLHGKTTNFGDILKIESLPNCDLLTYSFPCTDISTIGLQKGINENTKSGLLLQVKRLLIDYKKRDCLPKYLLMENVKNLVGKKFKKDFDDWCLFLEEIGYKNSWKIFNGINYGIPQNRNRVLMISELNGEKEINFSTSYKETKPAYEYLEEKVNIKYFNSNKLQACVSSMKNRNGFIRGKRYNPKLKSDFIYANTITTAPGSKANENFIIDNNYTKKELEEKDRYVTKENFGIRRLTPRERFRLSGFSDNEFDKLRPYLSDTQLCKQAGNTIIVTVLESIFKDVFFK